MTSDFSSPQLKVSLPHKEVSTICNFKMSFQKKRKKWNTEYLLLTALVYDMDYP